MIRSDSDQILADARALRERQTMEAATELYGHPNAPLRCCVCLSEDPDVEILCCVGGALHPKTCGRELVKRERIRTYPATRQLRLCCPGCRREYPPRILADHLLPKRKLIRCEGTVFPLDERSSFRIFVFENLPPDERRGVRQSFSRCEFSAGPESLPSCPYAIPPVSQYFDLHHHYHHSDPNTWPPPPQRLQLLLDPVFRTLKRRNDASTQTTVRRSPRVKKT